MGKLRENGGGICSQRRDVFINNVFFMALIICTQPMRDDLLKRKFKKRKPRVGLHHNLNKGLKFSILAGRHLA